MGKEKEGERGKDGRKGKEWEGSGGEGKGGKGRSGEGRGRKPPRQCEDLMVCSRERSSFKIFLISPTPQIKFFSQKLQVSHVYLPWHQ